MLSIFLILTAFALVFALPAIACAAGDTPDEGDVEILEQAERILERIVSRRQQEIEKAMQSLELEKQAASAAGDHARVIQTNIRLRTE